MEVVIGISAFGHDTSSCIVNFQTNEVIFASAEERFSNLKHDDSFPNITIDECLNIVNKKKYKIKKIVLASDYNLFLEGTVKNFLYGNLKDKLKADKIFENLKEAVKDGYYDYYFNKNLKISKILNTLKSNLESNELKDFKKILTWYFNWAVKNFKIYEEIEKKFSNFKIDKVSHHLSHAASSYFNSGFEDSSIIVMDGQGECETISVYEAKKNNFKLISKTEWPNSLGILYLESTKLLGFSLGDEYKVMGMSAYGRSNLNYIFKNFYTINETGEIIFNENDYIGFDFQKGTSHKTISFKKKIREIVPLVQNANFDQIHFDFAKSVQTITEKIATDLSKWVSRNLKSKNLCLSGGVALNGLMNNKIAKLGIFDDIFVYPASGDDGTSVGAAQFIVSKENINFKNNKKIQTCFFGFENSSKEIEDYLTNNNFENLEFKKERDIPNFVAKQLADNKVVSIFDNKAEFGPRSLGGRSILANPCNPKIKEILNLKIKLREPFRPFAPVCLENEVKNYFDIKLESNFMLFICETFKEKVNLIPGVVHQDFTARVQSVPKNNYLLHQILNEFKKITQVPILINTSFNVGGEAIVNDIDDAIKSFLYMDIDYLVTSEFICKKKKNLDKKDKLKSFIQKRQLKNRVNINRKISKFNHHFFYGKTRKLFHFFNNTSKHCF